MGILEVAQTAQTQLDRLCAETGLPASEVHMVVFTAKPEGWAIKFRLKRFDNLFMQPSSELEVTEDGTVVDCADDDELLRRAEMVDACRARAAELAPEPEPFDADEAIFNSDALVPQGVVWTVGMNGALVVDGDIAQIVRRRLGGPVDAVTGLDRLISPRAVPPEHSVCVVFANGVYVAEPDDLTLPRTYYVCTPDQTHEIAKWEDAVQTAVALATQETDA